MLATLDDCDIEKLKMGAILNIPTDAIELELEKNVNGLFQKLAKKLDAKKIFADVIPVDLQSYTTLQQNIEDEALLKIWGFSSIWRVQIQEAQFATHEEAQEATAEKVRDCFANPANLAKLSGFSCVAFADCGIKVIPPEFVFTNLQYLTCTNNKIRTIPECIGNLKHLKGAQLNDNRIRTIPEFISTMKSLRTLNLDNNRICHTPVSLIDRLASEKRTMMLGLKGNPILFIPEEEKKGGLCLIDTSYCSLELVKWFSKFHKNNDPSKFSKFVKLCLSDAIDKEKIKAAFESLSQELRVDVCGIVERETYRSPKPEYAQWAGKMACLYDAIEDMDFFCKALSNVHDKI
jgi:hypothetical protein